MVQTKVTSFLKQTPGKCSISNGFLKDLQNSQGNICIRVSFIIMLWADSSVPCQDI